MMIITLIPQWRNVTFTNIKAVFNGLFIYFNNYGT